MMSYRLLLKYLVLRIQIKVTKICIIALCTIKLTKHKCISNEGEILIIEWFRTLIR